MPHISYFSEFWPFHLLSSGDYLGLFLFFCGLFLFFCGSWKAASRTEDETPGSSHCYWTETFSHLNTSWSQMSFGGQLHYTPATFKPQRWWKDTGFVAKQSWNLSWLCRLLDDLEELFNLLEPLWILTSKTGIKFVGSHKNVPFRSPIVENVVDKGPRGYALKPIPGFGPRSRFPQAAADKWQDNAGIAR